MTTTTEPRGDVLPPLPYRIDPESESETIVHLEQQLAALEQQRLQEAQDWADTDSTVRAIAKRVLPAEWVDGSPEAIPPIAEIVERLEQQLSTVTGERDRIIKSLAREEREHLGTIESRDVAEEILNTMTAMILREDIDWPDHYRKWKEAENELSDILHAVRSDQKRAEGTGDVPDAPEIQEDVGRYGKFVDLITPPMTECEIVGLPSVEESLSDLLQAAEQQVRELQERLAGMEQSRRSWEIIYDRRHKKALEAECLLATTEQALAAARVENEMERMEIRPTMQPTPTSCFRACVATILGLGVDDVPKCCDGNSWDWEAFQEWLADTRQMQAVEVHLEAASCGVIYPIPRRIPVIVTGKSKRPCPSGRHAVVAMTVGMDGFELLHDPHPSSDGLDGEPTHVVFFCQMKPDATTPEPSGDVREPDLKDLAADFATEWCDGDYGEIRHAAYEMLQAACDPLQQRLAALEQQRLQEATDWADTDTTVRTIAKRVLPAEWVDGSPEAIPAVVDIVERLEQQLAAERESHEAEFNSMRNEIIGLKTTLAETRNAHDATKKTLSDTTIELGRANARGDLAEQQVASLQKRLEADPRCTVDMGFEDSPAGHRKHLWLNPSDVREYVDGLRDELSHAEAACDQFAHEQERDKARIAELQAGMEQLARERDELKRRYYRLHAVAADSQNANLDPDRHEKLTAFLKLFPPALTELSARDNMLRRREHPGEFESEEATFYREEAATLREQVATLQGALESAKHFIRKGIEVRMIDQWPVLQRLLPEVMANIEAALAASQPTEGSP